MNELLKEVYSKGYNIYQYINAFKKKQKLREDLPEDIYIKTCHDFLTYKDTIKTPYIYFQAMMKKNSANYFSICEQAVDKSVNTNLLKELGL